jgi:hypothetical protein
MLEKLLPNLRGIETVRRIGHTVASETGVILSAATGYDAFSRTQYDVFGGKTPMKERLTWAILQIYLASSAGLYNHLSSKPTHPEEHSQPISKKEKALIALGLGSDVIFHVGAIAYLMGTGWYENIPSPLGYDPHGLEHTFAAKAAYNVTVQAGWRTPAILTSLIERFNTKNNNSTNPVAIN